jgi:hypothetical protein
MRHNDNFDDYKSKVNDLILANGYEGPIDNGFIQDDYDNNVSEEESASGFLLEHSVEDTENNEDGDILGTGDDDYSDDDENYEGDDDSDDDDLEGQ